MMCPTHPMGVPVARFPASFDRPPGAVPRHFLPSHYWCCCCCCPRWRQNNIQRQVRTRPNPSDASSSGACTRPAFLDFGKGRVPIAEFQIVQGFGVRVRCASWCWCGCVSARRGRPVTADCSSFAMHLTQRKATAWACFFRFGTYVVLLASTYPLLLFQGGVVSKVACTT